MEIVISILLVIGLLGYLIFSIILQNKTNQLMKKLNTQLTKLNEQLNKQGIKAENTVPNRNAFK